MFSIISTLEWEKSDCDNKIAIFSNAMEKIVAITKENCIEQGQLIHRLWKSTFDIHERVHKLMCKAVKELRCEQMDNNLEIRKLKHHIRQLNYNFQNNSVKPSIRNSDMRLANDETTTVSSLKDELLLKDRELLDVEHLVTQLHAWFPHFKHYSNSLLTKLLPPVNILDAETSPDIMLLEDLRRLEGIGIGFKVIAPEERAAIEMNSLQRWNDSINEKSRSMDSRSEYDPSSMMPKTPQPPQLQGNLIFNFCI